MSIACICCRNAIRRIRGNCQKCYAKHVRAIRKGLTTWEQLEKDGLLLPRKPKDGNSEFFKPTRWKGVCNDRN